MDGHDELRNKFDFGAAPLWNPSSAMPDESKPRPRDIPGTFPLFPADQIQPERVPGVAPAHAEEPRNPERTCRICLSGAEDGISVSDLLIQDV
jgi:hypothetical protein